MTSANLNMTTICGLPEIFLAAWSGNFKKINELIFAGVDANIETKKGWTPLMMAARNGHANAVKVLLKYGANVDQTNFNNDTALIWAAHSSSEVIRILLKKGAAIDAENQNGHSAITVAAKMNNLEAVKELLRWNPDLSRKTADGETVMHVAAENATLAVFQQLLENSGEVSPVNSFGNTPLILAAKFNKPDIVQLLLSWGASVDEKNFGNNTALHWAASNGSMAIVQELFSKGADINVENSRGWRPFALALEGHHYELCKFLIAEGAFLGRNIYGYSAVHLAAGVGSVDILREILATGASMKAKDWKKRTPLDYANILGNRATARELLLNTPGISESSEQQSATIKDKSIGALNDVRSKYFKTKELLINVMGPLLTKAIQILKGGFCPLKVV